MISVTVFTVMENCGTRVCFIVYGEEKFISGVDLGGRKVRRCIPMEILIIDILKL